MKWFIHQLTKYRQKGLEINEYVDLHELVQVHQDLRAITPVHVVGRADIGSARVVFHLSLSGEMTLPCARTLVDVKYPFHIQTSETFLLNDYDQETDESTHAVHGDVIDLRPIVRELVLLEIPQQVFSDEVEPARNGAPQEGKGWKIVTEEERKNKVDPRMAKLAQLLEKNKND